MDIKLMEVMSIEVGTRVLGDIISETGNSKPIIIRALSALPWHLIGEVVWTDNDPLHRLYIVSDVERDGKLTLKPFQGGRKKTRKAWARASKLEGWTVT